MYNEGYIDDGFGLGFWGNLFGFILTIMLLILLWPLVLVFCIYLYFASQKEDQTNYDRHEDCIDSGLDVVDYSKKKKTKSKRKSKKKKI